MLRKSITLIFILSVSFNITAQNKTFCKQIELVNDLIAKHHISPKPINDTLSAQVWDSFIEALDPDRRYLLESDLVIFEKDKYRLDDYFRKDKCKFIKHYAKTFEDRLDETREILEELQLKNFNYFSTDSLYFDASRERNFAEDQESKAKDWTRAMKYETVTEAIKRFDDKQSFLTAFDNIKPEVKTFVLNRAFCAIDEIKQHQNGFEQYVQEIFINALTTVHDPHSIYFNNAEKKAFDSAYSSNSLSFGITTDKNDKGQIIIYDVNSNSPAALDNKIEAGDILRSLKSGKKTLITSCISNQEVINFLSEEAHKTVEFEIEKPRGQLKSVSLTKTIIPIEYNVVDAFVIDEDIKAGYVNIPSFYVNTESGDWRGTSLDMGKALYKLLQEDIDGLLIDLRQNGGGSMKEAIDLANLFVDGPIAILKHKDDVLTIYNSKKAALFNKPIVILIDSYTASAAELFAGVMQDYKKAVIVGVNSYGKATSQNIFPLNSEDESLGFLKITSEKFYRISGRSHQKVGIKPDISISNIFEGIANREIDYKYVLEADTLQVSEKIETLNISIKKLKSQSNERQENNEVFKQVTNANKQLKYFILAKKEQYSFTPEHIYDDLVRYDKIWANISSLLENKKFLTINQTDYDLKYNTKDSKRLEMIKTFISGDPTVLESFRVLKDFISSQNSSVIP